MALPSTSRPQEIEDDIREMMMEAGVTELPEGIKITVSRSKAFQDMMESWYESLSDAKKLMVTPERLKQKAMDYCKFLYMSYDTLPLTWVIDLKEKTGLEFCASKSEMKKKLAEMKEKLINTEHPPLRNPRRAKVACEQKIQIQLLGADKLVEKDPAKYQPTVKISKEEKEKADQAIKKKMPATREAASDEEEDDKPRPKKFLDLTGLPPPKEWLMSYFNGVKLPRIHSIYSTESHNILYWDYNPKLVDSKGKDIVLQPTPVFRN